MFQLFMHVFYWHHPWRRVISAAKAPLTCTDSCSLAAHSILVVRLRHSLLSWPFVYPTASSLRVSPLIAMCLLRATDHQSSMALRTPPPPYHEYTAGFSAAPLTPPWFGTKKLAISPVNTLGLDHWLDDSLPRVGQLTADTHA